MVSLPSVVDAPLLPVICIDDEPDDLYFLGRNLLKAGLKNPILNFGDSDAAVAYLSKFGTYIAPCIVFCDLKMPGRSGFEVLKWFREESRFSHIVFVTLSGSSLPADRERALALGANEYFVKFPLTTELKALIERAASQVVALGSN